MASPDLSRRKTVRLTTRGRKSGAPRSVTIWFVADGPQRILVQHAAAGVANWYRNLAADPAVTVDFGEGPLPGRGTPITEPERIREVLARIRRKYWFAFLIQWLGRRATPVAAEISWAAPAGEDQPKARM